MDRTTAHRHTPTRPVEYPCWVVRAAVIAVQTRTILDGGVAPRLDEMVVALRAIPGLPGVLVDAGFDAPFGEEEFALAVVERGAGEGFLRSLVLSLVRGGRPGKGEVEADFYTRS